MGASPFQFIRSEKLHVAKQCGLGLSGSFDGISRCHQPAKQNGADDPLSLVPFAEKVALCERIDAAVRARDPRVAQVSVALAASWSVIDIVRADGFVASDVRPLVRLGVQIVAEQKGRRESGYHGLGGRYRHPHRRRPGNALWRCPLAS